MYDVQNQEVDLMFNLVSSLALIHTNKYLIWLNLILVFIWYKIYNEIYKILSK